MLHRQKASTNLVKQSVVFSTLLDLASSHGFTVAHESACVLEPFETERARVALSQVRVLEMACHIDAHLIYRVLAALEWTMVLSRYSVPENSNVEILGCWVPEASGPEVFSRRNNVYGFSGLEQVGPVLRTRRHLFVLEQDLRRWFIAPGTYFHGGFATCRRLRRRSITDVDTSHEARSRGQSRLHSLVMLGVSSSLSRWYHR